MTPSEPRFKPTTFTPTDEQLAIQTHRERKVVVVADAGAAKTTTLALRLAESLRRQVAPEHLLGLTFSDEAAAVLRKRLEEMGVAPTLARRVRIQTFRAFALQVLANHFNDRAPVRDRPEELAPMVRAAVHHVRKRAEARGVTISSALPEYNAQIAEFLELSQLLKAQMYGLDDADEENADPIEEQARQRDIDPFLLRLHVEVERQRRLVDVVWRTSEDAVFDLVRLLDQNASSALPAFRVIVIDEMQDMNPITARLVEHMERAPRTFITAAGDFDQVIHSRRGATVDFVMSLVNAPGVERMRLSKTFRHGPAMTHATAYKKTTPTASGRVVRADIWVREYAASDPATAAPHVVKAIKAWRKSDEANKAEDQAVILRSPHLSIEIESALMAEAIAYRCEGFDSYLVRPETLVLRGIVAYALKAPETIADPATRLRALEAMLQWQEFNWADARQQELEVAANDAGTWSAFVEGLLLRPRTAGDNADALLSEEQVAVRESVQLARIRELDQAGRRTEAEDMRARLRDARTRIVETPRERAARERLQRVVNYLNAADSTLPAHVVLQEVARLLDIKAVARRIFIEPNNAREATASIDGFIALARSQDKPLREFATWLQTQELILAKTRANRALLLATVEAAKGQEFGSVVVPFLCDGEFPLANVQEREEANRFYVAITRMRDELTVIVAEGQPHRYVSSMRVTDSLKRGNAVAYDQDEDLE